MRASVGNSQRCSWCLSSDQYIAYHDTEWGVETRGDNALFELLTLESFQSGLSWAIVLRKRNEFRKSFEAFNLKKVAAFDDKKVQELLCNEGIIRHRGKIEAAVDNAQLIGGLFPKKNGFSDYLWSYAPPRPEKFVMRSTCFESDALSKDLKKKGFKFVGSTTTYSLMQASGMVNDHEPHCFRFGRHK